MIKIYEKCFEILSENNLTIISRKYLFCKSEISAYEHKISADDIKLLDEKINAILNFQDPTSAKEIRSFLGLINFLARFIPNLLSEADAKSYTQKYTMGIGRRANKFLFEMKKISCK